MSIPASIRIFVARDAVDFRKAHDGLLAVIRDAFRDERPAPARPAAATSRSELQKQQKKLQQAVQQLEQQIEQCEAQRAELGRQLEDPATWRDGPGANAVQREFDALSTRLAALTATWEVQATQLEQSGRR